MAKQHFYLPSDSQLTVSSVSTRITTGHGINLAFQCCTADQVSEETKHKIKAALPWRLATFLAVILAEQFPPRVLLTQGLPDSEVCGISGDLYLMSLTPASLSLQLCFLQLKKTGEAVLRDILQSPANFLFWNRKKRREKKEKAVREEKDGYGRVSHSHLSGEWESFPSCYSQWTKLHHASWPLPSFVKQVPEQTLPCRAAAERVSWAAAATSKEQQLQWAHGKGEHA